MMMMMMTMIMMMTIRIHFGSDSAFQRLRSCSICIERLALPSCEYFMTTTPSDTTWDINPYALCVADYRSTAIKIRRAVTYRVDWGADEHIPDRVRRSAAENLYAYETKGDGACAIHAIFGCHGSLRCVRSSF